MPVPRRVDPMKGTNSYSQGSVSVPDGPKKPVKTKPTTPNEIVAAKEGQAYGRGARKRRAAYEAGGGRPARVDSNAQQALAKGVPAKDTLDMVRGTYMHADPAHIGTAKAGSGEKVPRTVVQGTPNINEPHQTTNNVIPARRWEDLHSSEQKKTLDRVKQFGSSPEKMQSDLRDQVLSAHERAGRNLQSTPFSSRFYEGPSLPHFKIEEGADEVQAHPGFEGDRTHARAMVVVANSATSPNTKFQQGDRFPNHEAAMHSVRHALSGGSPETVGRPEGVGGVYPANLEKASHLATQMTQGRQTRDVLLSSGRHAFDPRNAPKTTDYTGAWTDPTGPDSRYVSDVHSTHSLMPHLGTGKSVAHQLPDGSRRDIYPHETAPKGAVPIRKVDANGKDKIVTGGSESEDYLAGNKVGLSALHDHIARKVAVDLGMSHSVHNAGATHFLQATDWGEEQIGRPDVHDRTEAAVYGGDARIAAKGHDIEMRTPARGRMVHSGPPSPPDPGVGPFHHLANGAGPSSSPRVGLSTAQFAPKGPATEDQTWGYGDQKRHEATTAKVAKQNRGQRRAAAATADPNYRKPAGEW